MTRWLKRGAVALVSVALFVLSLATADAFLFRYRARQMFRLVEDAPLGSSVLDADWMASKYPSPNNDGYPPLVVRLGPTELEFERYLRIFPRDLLMRPAGASGSFNHEAGRIVGKRVSIGTNVDRDGYFTTLATAAEGGEVPDTTIGPYRVGPVYAYTSHPGFELLQPRGENEALIWIHPNATPEQRRAAYDFDFNCLWRWNRCKSATDLLSAAKR